MRRTWGGSLGVAASVVLVMAASHVRAQTLECAAVSSGGGITSNGSILVVGQSVVGTMSSANFTIDAGIIACLAALDPCAVDDDCDDGDPCTADACLPGDEGAAGNGCVNEFVQRVFGDVAHPFAGETGSAQPDLDDILCVLAGFAAGGDWPTVCPLGDLLTDSLPTCALDGGIDLADILAVLGAFEGNFTCPSPCP